MKKGILAVLILIYFEARATELFEYNIPTRARGMGGVYAEFPSETDAIFVNPAYLTQVKEIAWDIADINIGAGGYSNLAAFQQVSSSSGTSNYSALYGKNIRLTGNGHTSVALPYFGFAAYDNVQLYGGLNSPPFPDFNLGLFNDVGFQMGFGVPIGPTLSVGGSLKRLQRLGGEQPLGLSTIAAGSAANIQSQFTNAGTGWGGDVAVMAKVPGVFSPSLVAMWKDVGAVQFSKTSGSDNPPRIADNLILGAGTLLDLPGFDWRAGAEFWHTNDATIQYAKKIHLGTEISLPLIDLRAGLSQGYQSYGAGLNLWFLKVDAAYYTVETGEYPGQSPDIRLEASVSIQLSVDADFNFNGKDGKRRHLKQRR